MKKLLLVLTMVMALSLAIVPAFALEGANAGDSITFDIDTYALRTLADDLIPGDYAPADVPGAILWSYASPNLACTVGEDGYFVFSKISDGDGSAQVRYWGVGANSDPVIFGIVFNCTAADRDSIFLNIYGDVGGLSPYFASITPDDNGTYAIKNGAGEVVKTGISLNEDHTLNAVFEEGVDTYTLALDGVILGQFAHQGEYTGAVSNARIDNISIKGDEGYLPGTIKIAEVYFAEGTYDITAAGAETGDFGFVAIAVLCVALLATVVFTKKRVFSK